VTSLVYYKENAKCSVLLVILHELFGSLMYILLMLISLSL